MEFEGRQRLRGGINLVPLINVVFLLLIFFMLAGTLRVPELFNLEVPESESGAAAEDQAMEIVIGSAGQLAVNGTEIPRAMLAEALAEHFSGDRAPAITFKIDARAQTGDMIDVLGELHAAGAETVFLSTRPVRSD